jgi:hypothetical protein
MSIHIRSYVWVIASALLFAGRGGTDEAKRVSLAYQSQFVRGGASEQFLWRIERRGAVLLGYHVNSPLLLAQ